MDSDFMNDLVALLVERGWQVVRFEFSYMRARRGDGKKKPPDRQQALLQCWREVIAQAGGAANLVIGGKSMGGRMASMLADDVGARGLVCLGYPFHPRGRPARLRTAHLESLQTPTLIFQGTRDPLGSEDEVVFYPLSRAISLHWLPDGDHDLKPRVRSGYTRAQHLHSVAEVTTASFLQ